MARSELSAQMRGYGLTTAEILYHMPDHPGLLQTFLWQTWDLAPRFPELHRFLRFWTKELDGTLHSVRFAHKGVIGPAEWRKVDVSTLLH